MRIRVPVSKLGVSIDISAPVEENEAFVSKSIKVPTAPNASPPDIFIPVPVLKLGPLNAKSVPLDSVGASILTTVPPTLLVATNDARADPGVFSNALALVLTYNTEPLAILLPVMFTTVPDMGPTDLTETTPLPQCFAWETT